MPAPAPAADERVIRAGPAAAVAQRERRPDERRDQEQELGTGR